MRYINFNINGEHHLGLVDGDDVVSLGDCTLEELLAQGVDLTLAPKAAGLRFKRSEITYLPPLTRPGKIVCVGLNYTDHSKESNYDQPAHPTFFLRVTTSLTSHQGPIIRPLHSDALWPVRLAAFAGRRRIAQGN